MSGTSIKLGNEKKHILYKNSKELKKDLVGPIQDNKSEVVHYQHSSMMTLTGKLT